MSNANGEVTQGDYIRYLGITIPVNASPVSLRSLIEAAAPGLTDEEKLRVIQILIKDHGAEFLVGDTDDLSETNETVEATGVYTEPCIGGVGGYLDKTFVAVVAGAALPCLCKCYIGQAPNEASRT